MGPGGVLVGVDFSDAARVALDYAALIAAKMGKSLHVVHAWNPTGFAAGLLADSEGLGELLEKARAGAEVRLQEWSASVSSDAVEVSWSFESGPGSRILPDLAKRLGAGLLVVGRHGHASLAHVFLGSVSERIVRMSPCPVLVVPRREGIPVPPTRLLVGGDFSNGAREALRTAIRFAEDLHCERGIVLAHAYQGERELWLANGSELHLAENQQSDRRRLERWAKGELTDALPVEYAAISGYAVQMLPAAAADWDCDWIVLGVRGRTALASFLIGSPTRRILKLAHRPVLVVPPREPPDFEPVD